MKTKYTNHKPLFFLTDLKLKNKTVMLRVYLILALLSAWCADTLAQQTPLYSQSYLNPYLYNPAFAGAKEYASAYFLYRRQWAGVDGAPETQVFTVDGMLKTVPVGLGLTFFNDITNVIGRTGGAVTGAYKASLTENQTLRFGMSFMAIRNRIFFDRIRTEDISDPNLLTSVDQRTAFESNAGIAYQYKKLIIGFSGEQLFQNNFEYKNEALFRSLNYTLVRHYYTSAQYEFQVNEALTIEPRVLIRTVQGLSSQFDGNVLLNYKDITWLNLNYKHNIGVGLSVGFAVEDQFVFSYAYEHPTTDLNIINSSSHEFMLGIRLKKVYNKNAPSSKAMRNSGAVNTAEYEKMDAIMQQNELVSQRLEKAEEQLAIQDKELAELRAIVNEYSSELDKTIERLEAKESDSITNESRFYVVVGALHKLNNAKVFQRILRRESRLDTKVVQSASGNWYFIYAGESDSFADAKSMLKEVRSGDARKYIIGEPWIYNAEKE